MRHAKHELQQGTRYYLDESRLEIGTFSHLNYGILYFVPNGETRYFKDANGFLTFNVHSLAKNSFEVVDGKNETNPARDEYCDIIIGLCAKHFEAKDKATEKEIEERLLSITFDRIKVLEEALERNKSTAEAALRV